MWRHLVGSFVYRSGAWFQVDDEFDSSSGGNPWKFFRKDVLEFVNDGNVFNTLEWCSVQCIQGIKSCLGILNQMSQVSNYFIRRVEQMDGLSGANYRSSMHFQPIHS